MQFRDHNELVQEINRLHQNGYQKVGNLDLAQICDHCSYFVEGTLDGHTFRVPWLLKVLFGRMALRRTMKTKRIKPGLPSPQKPMPAPGGDEVKAMARLHHAMERLKAHSGEMHPSPFFGYLTPQEWREFHLIHCAHHLGFLVPKATA
jgi:hypothetical protein